MVHKHWVPQLFICRSSPLFFVFYPLSLSFLQEWGGGGGGLGSRPSSGFAACVCQTHHPATPTKFEVQYLLKTLIKTRLRSSTGDFV